MMRLFPLLLCFVLGLIFWQALSLHPQELPSQKIGKVLPNFKIKTLENGVLQAKTFKQGKHLLNVFSSWCDACAKEQAFMLSLAAQGISIYGLNYMDKPDLAKQWLKTYGNPYRSIASDVNGELAVELGVYGTPETFLIGEGGKILYRHAGILTLAVWEEVFAPLMETSK